MTNSIFQRINLTCHNCLQTFDDNIWLIIDTKERPDLLHQLREGKINAITCPHCQFTGLFDGPLLIYQPEQKPVILFSPAQQASQEQNEKQATQLLNALRQTLGPSWQDVWLNEGLISVESTLLPVVLNQNQKLAESQIQIPKVTNKTNSLPTGIYSILTELQHTPMHKQYMSRRVELCRKALDILPRKENEQMWANLQGELGDSLFQNPNGDPAENIDLAIHAYHEALQIVTYQTSPDDWVINMMNLAIAYSERIWGDKSENIEQTISAYQQILQFVTFESMPDEWSTIMMNLAIAYRNRVQGNRAENIEEAISTNLQALQVTTHQTAPDKWAKIMTNLANAYLSRLQGNPAENIEQAIATYQNALQIRTRQNTPVEWANTIMNLANAFRDRKHGEREENIEQAISYYRQALQIITRPQMPVKWAIIMMNLANTYVNRIRGEYEENIEEAIACYQQAMQVDIRQTMPTEWASAMRHLATLYDKRVQGETAQNIELAIEAYLKALQVTTYDKTPVDWAEIKWSLASAYQKRIHGDRGENMERAITAYNQAVQVFSYETMPEKWAAIMSDLATAYSHRTQGDIAKNIERAIDHYHKALSIITFANMPIEWATVMTNLGVAYYSRTKGNRAKNIERAISIYQDVLQKIDHATTPDQWAMTTANLANTYADRVLGERTENIERAIDYYFKVLQIITLKTSPIEWAATTMNLANAYFVRVQGDRAENIERAIDYYLQTLQVRTQKAFPADYAHTMMNLANAYYSRIRGNQTENFKQAIAAYRNALKVRTREAMPIEWAITTMNLANAFRNNPLGSRSENIEQAIAAYLDALQVITESTMPFIRAQAIVGLALAYSDRVSGERSENIEQAINMYNEALILQEVDLYPADHLKTQLNLGRLLFGEQMWSPAQTAYDAAINASRFLLDAAYTEYGQQAIVYQSSEIYAHATYAAWQIGQLPTALRQLEQGKTRLLAIGLSLGETNISRLPTKQQYYLREMRQQIMTLEAAMRSSQDMSARRDDRDLAEMLRQARSELRQLLVSIERTYPEFLPSSLDVPEILALIPLNGVLIAPFVTTNGGAVFVIPHGTKTITKEHILPLPTLTTEHLSALIQGDKDKESLGGWLGAYAHFQQNPGSGGAEIWFQALNTVTGKLWDVLMGPIYKQLATFNLEKRASLLLIPQGGLGLLPLHAAWQLVDGQPRYFCDDYTVTYIPSAYALHINKQQVTQPERQSRSLFAVINPTRDLKYTPFEGEAIAQFFSLTNQTILNEKDATSTAFPSAAKGHAYIHYSGHGYYHWRDPSQSGLQLADKPYTLSDILSGLDLSACRLVTLSACETGITEFQKAPDEYVGLPAGFLQAGTPAVISTLWAVNDLSTMLLMERFYQLHLQDGLEIAQALRQAQLWLRDVTAGELAGRFGYEAQQLMTRLTKEEALSYWYRFENMDEEERPFAHPYYWAAFTFTGA